MSNIVPIIKPDWQPLADKLSEILGREIISGQRYKRDDDREFYVKSGGRTANEILEVTLPPYSEADLYAIDKEWHGLTTNFDLFGKSQWVIGQDDSWNSWILRVGVDFDALNNHSLRVRWPSAWDATAYGRGDMHCSSSLVDIRENATPDGWHLRVWALNLNDCTLGLRGLIDIDGKFVLPCEYESISKIEGLLAPLSKTTAEPLPTGRLTHWMWAEVLKPNDPTKDCHGREVCDVIEVWSGKRVNPDGTKALRNSLSRGYFHVTLDSTDSKRPLGSELGLMLASLPNAGPMRWKRILGNYPFGAIAAQCANSGLYGYIGATGQTVMEPQFATASSFRDDWTIVQSTDGKFGAIAIDFEKMCEESLAATMTTLPWRWLLQPVWDDIADEYDGHFTVQNDEKKWGMITPQGKPVSPFELRENYRSINEIHTACRMQFKRLQQQRFVEKLIAISNKPDDQRSLEPMLGFLFSSWGRYDYGSLGSSKLIVRVRRDVLGAGLFKQQDFEYKNLPHEFKAGSLFEWEPSTRTYVGTVDLSTHAVLQQDGSREMERAFVPWAALDLILPNVSPLSIDEKDITNHVQQIAATKALYVALNTLGLWLESHRFIHKNQTLAHQTPSFFSMATLPENAIRDDYWDTEDAIRAVFQLAQALHFELLGMLLKDKNKVEIDFFSTSLDHCLRETDITSLFQKNRYASDAVEVDDRFRQTPFWIGSDGNQAAIAIDHPWVVEMQVLRKKTMDAYETWQVIYQFQ